MQKVTIGGDRLGSGKKMKVELHGYERSTHDLGYLWRSTASAGTLIPFMNEIALPGDTWDIELDCDVKTHPTIGPLFGSYKVQNDIFIAPLRLYNSALHNNMLGIGRNMSQVKFPKIELIARNYDEDDISDFDNSQINPSCILAYLGLRGIGNNTDNEGHERKFFGSDLLTYWDIVKNYYANKQEDEGAVIHTPSVANVTTVDAIRIKPLIGAGTVVIQNGPPQQYNLGAPDSYIRIEFTGAQPRPEQLFFKIEDGGYISLEELVTSAGFQLVAAGILQGKFNQIKYGSLVVEFWRYATAQDGYNGSPTIYRFPLSDIDEMRTKVLQAAPTAEFIITAENLEPYKFIAEAPGGMPNIMKTQEGLAVKTFQSDLFNNWINTDWIDGAGGITEITAIDTSSGEFTVDTLILAKKVYDMLNRIGISGGTYKDWVNVVYDHEGFWQVETPMYMGGLIKELVFQEVVSNSATDVQSEQPLGTLAGKGIMGRKHKGGKIVIKVNEPSIIMGIFSLTPRVDYSQGNRWHVHLNTMDDLHKPPMDQIGFQELIVEQFAWWNTTYNGISGLWEQNSAGKQPAWINYMTNYNRTYGNFAIESNEMFMTLNRRYERNGTTVVDLTTYIDPSKFNFIFANTALDAQNFWVQISVDATVRRKMSAKIMPNL